MRFWAKVGGKVCGPLMAEEIVRLPDVSRHTLLCPEGNNFHNSKNWRFARSFQEVEALLKRPLGQQQLDGGAAPPRLDVPPPRAARGAEPEPDRAAPGRPRPWPRAPAGGVALVLLGFLLWRHSREDAPAPARPKMALAEGAEGALQAVIPACGKTIRELAGEMPLTREAGGGRYEIFWDGADGEVRIQYDEERRQFTPLTAAARALFDIRGTCARKP